MHVARNHGNCTPLDSHDAAHRVHGIKRRIKRHRYEPRYVSHLSVVPSQKPNGYHPPSLVISLFHKPSGNSSPSLTFLFRPPRSNPILPSSVLNCFRASFNSFSMPSSSRTRPRINSSLRRAHLKSSTLSFWRRETVAERAAAWQISIMKSVTSSSRTRTVSGSGSRESPNA